MTILTVVQDSAVELKLRKPTSVVASTDSNVILLLSMAHRAGKELRRRWDWAKLTKERTFTTTNGTSDYALPGDIHFEHFQTHWDRTNHWPLRGPMSPQRWQERKSGITSTHPRLGFRISGYTDTTFHVEPVPTSTLTLVFEYQTRNWILPKAWVTLTAYTVNTYVSKNGNIYKCTVAGTSGATGPTHTSGTAVDGTVTWEFQTLYEAFLADTDISQIDEELLILELKWRWKQANGFPYEDFKMEAEEAARLAYSAQRSAQVVPLTGRQGSPLVDYWSIPDGSYG